MPTPKISIISACYNHGKYIHEMIDSVLNQTFQDFEIIIVNDGSTDNTKEILDKIQHEKIRIIHSEHRGPSHARNLAISNAKADVIFNLDADDKISGDLLEKGFDVLLKSNNVGIVYTECKYFGARSGKFRVGSYSLERMLVSNRIVSAAFLRKSDWEKCGGYSEVFAYGLEDWDLWLSIIEQGREVVKIPDSCFYYRIYPKPCESRSGKRNSDRSKALNSVLLVYKRHYKLYSGYPTIMERFLQYEIEKNSALKKRIRNMIFPLRYKFACLVH